MAIFLEFGREAVLVEGMQDAGAGEPVRVAVVEAATKAVGWNARDVVAIGELGIYKVILGFDAPDAVPDRSHVILSCDFHAIEPGIALIEHDAVQFGVTVSIAVAHDAESQVTALTRSVL